MYDELPQVVPAVAVVGFYNMRWTYPPAFCPPERRILTVVHLKKVDIEISVPEAHLLFSDIFHFYTLRISCRSSTRKVYRVFSPGASHRGKNSEFVPRATNDRIVFSCK